MPKFLFDEAIHGFRLSRFKIPKLPEIRHLEGFNIIGHDEVKLLKKRDIPKETWGPKGTGRARQFNVWKRAKELCKINRPEPKGHWDRQCA